MGKKKNTKKVNDVVYIAPPISSKSSDSEPIDYDPQIKVMDEFEKDLQFLLQDPPRNDIAPTITSSLTKLTGSNSPLKPQEQSVKSSKNLTRKVRSEIMDFDIDFSSDEENDVQVGTSTAENYLKEELSLLSDDSDSGSEVESSSEDADYGKSRFDRELLDEISDEEEYIKAAEDFEHNTMSREEFDQLDSDLKKLSLSGSQENGGQKRKNTAKNRKARAPKVDSKYVDDQSAGRRARWNGKDNKVQPNLRSEEKDAKASNSNSNKTPKSKHKEQNNTRNATSQKEKVLPDLKLKDQQQRDDGAKVKKAKAKNEQRKTTTQVKEHDGETRVKNHTKKNDKKDQSHSEGKPRFSDKTDRVQPSIEEKLSKDEKAKQLQSTIAKRLKQLKESDVSPSNKEPIIKKRQHLLPKTNKNDRSRSPKKSGSPVENEA